MDLSQSVRFLEGQGLVFWAAAAAVAAGCALLAAAGMMQWRRRLAARSAAPARQGVQLTATGYTAVPAPTALTPPPAATAPTPDPRLGELQTRLAAAATRLEGLRSSRTPVSGLKTTPERVDYVHKSGRA